MTAIIVLGQICGGTSATAGALARLGLPYATSPLADHFEDLDLRGEMPPHERAELLREREQEWGPGPWVYKDPHALHDWQWWTPHVRDFARFVIVMRDPAAIVAEWASHHEAFLTASSRLASLTHAALTLEPHLLVSYEKLVLDPQAVSAQLAEFAGVRDRPGAAEFIVPGSYHVLPHAGLDCPLLDSELVR